MRTFIARVCNKCNKLKQSSQFGSDSSRLAGISYRCLECDAKKSQKYYASNREKVCKRVKKYARSKSA